MKKPSIVTVAVLAFASLFSCSKKDKNATTTTSYSSSQDVFNALNLKPKTISLDATTGGSFYGNSGTRYIFSANSFITESGANVTGTVQIQACEYLLKGDMLFSKMLPISNNDPLLSAGEINVSASQNGQIVYIKPGNSFIANIPQTGALATATRFFGGRQPLDTTIARTNWIPIQLDSTGHARNFIEIFPSNDTLSIVSDSMRLCNADAFMTSPNYQTFTVTISIAGTTLTTSSPVFLGYAFYDNYKAVWPIGRIGSYASGVFTEQHVPNIPVHFVVFGVLDGKFYGGTTGSITPATGMNYTVTLEEQDATAFKARLNTL